MEQGNPHIEWSQTARRSQMSGNPQMTNNPQLRVNTQPVVNSGAQNQNDVCLQFFQHMMTSMSNFFMYNSHRNGNFIPQQYNSNLAVPRTVSNEQSLSNASTLTRDPRSRNFRTRMSEIPASSGNQDQGLSHQPYVSNRQLNDERGGEEQIPGDFRDDIDVHHENVQLKDHNSFSRPRGVLEDSQPLVREHDLQSDLSPESDNTLTERPRYIIPDSQATRWKRDRGFWSASSRAFEENQYNNDNVQNIPSTSFVQMSTPLHRNVRVYEIPSHRDRERFSYSAGQGSLRSISPRVEETLSRKRRRTNQDDWEDSDPAMERSNRKRQKWYEINQAVVNQAIHYKENGRNENYSYQNYQQPCGSHLRGINDDHVEEPLYGQGDDFECDEMPSESPMSNLQESDRDRYLRLQQASAFETDGEYQFDEDFENEFEPPINQPYEMIDEDEDFYYYPQHQMENEGEIELGIGIGDFGENELYDEEFQPSEVSCSCITKKNSRLRKRCSCNTKKNSRLPKKRRSFPADGKPPAGSFPVCIVPADFPLSILTEPLKREILAGVMRVFAQEKLPYKPHIVGHSFQKPGVLSIFCLNYDVTKLLVKKTNSLLPTWNKNLKVLRRKRLPKTFYFTASVSGYNQRQLHLIKTLLTECNPNLSVSEWKLYCLEFLRNTLKFKIAIDQKSLLELSESGIVCRKSAKIIQLFVNFKSKSGNTTQLKLEADPDVSMFRLVQGLPKSQRKQILKDHNILNDDGPVLTCNVTRKRKRSKRRKISQKKTTKKKSASAINLKSMGGSKQLPFSIKLSPGAKPKEPFVYKENNSPASLNVSEVTKQIATSSATNPRVLFSEIKSVPDGCDNIPVNDTKVTDVIKIDSSDDESSELNISSLEPYIKSHTNVHGSPGLFQSRENSSGHSSKNCMTSEPESTPNDVSPSLNTDSSTNAEISDSEFNLPMMNTKFERNKSTNIKLESYSPMKTAVDVPSQVVCPGINVNASELGISHHGIDVVPASMKNPTDESENVACHDTGECDRVNSPGIDTPLSCEVSMPEGTPTDVSYTSESVTNEKSNAELNLQNPTDESTNVLDGEVDNPEDLNSPIIETCPVSCEVSVPEETLTDFSSNQESGVSTTSKSGASTTSERSNSELNLQNPTDVSTNVCDGIVDQPEDLNSPGIETCPPSYVISVPEATLADVSCTSESGASTTSESGASTTSESGASTTSESGASTTSESGATITSERSNSGLSLDLESEKNLDVRPKCPPEVVESGDIETSTEPNSSDSGTCTNDQPKPC